MVVDDMGGQPAFDSREDVEKVVNMGTIEGL
jgi:hypothetical protein